MYIKQNIKVCYDVHKIIFKRNVCCMYIKYDKNVCYNVHKIRYKCML
jgi:hypothetical protein